MRNTASHASAHLAASRKSGAACASAWSERKGSAAARPASSAQSGASQVAPVSPGNTRATAGWNEGAVDFAKLKTRIRAIEQRNQVTHSVWAGNEEGQIV